MEIALEAGAEDFKTDPNGYEVLTDPARFEAVHKAIEAGGLKAAGAEVTWLPVITTPLQDAKAAGEAIRLIDILEEHEDVKEVYSNAEFPE